jgi:hypothetical protein
MSSAGNLWNLDRNGIDQSSLNGSQTDLENAQVAAVVTIDQMAQTLMDRLSAHVGQPGIQECNGQGQTRQFQEILQQGLFQFQPSQFQQAGLS